MEPASPPKRVTRARAARVGTATSGTASSAAKSVKTAATAATKLKATRAGAPNTASSSDTAPAARKSAKRKTRADENEYESEAETVAKRPPPASRTATRAARGPGRPKKTAEPEPEPPAPRATRGRPPKKLATETIKEPAPARATRTRAKKVETEEDNEDIDDLAPEPVVKKRGRPPGPATSTSMLASKPAKKTVTFAEPGKENVVPPTGARKTGKAADSAPPATGMRAKPVRKPAGTGRTTRTAATTSKKKGAKEAAEEKQASMPLSPKKISQLSANRDRDADSEDELAMDRTPARPFHRSPVKPRVGAKAPVKPQEEDGTDEEEEDKPVLEPAESTVLLGSPIRRLPQSSSNNSMKSPARRVDGLQLNVPAAAESLKTASTPFKASLLQSPAKRPPMPMKSVDLDPFTSREASAASPFKQSLLQSPAKRPFSPAKPRREPEEHSEERSPAPTPVLLCPPPPAEDTTEERPNEQVKVAEETQEPAENAAPPAKSDFNGRMSTVLPREADPALERSTTPTDQQEEDDDGDTVVLEDEERSAIEIYEDSGDPMAVDEPAPGFEGADDPADVSTTPPNSPPQGMLSMFGLREKDLLPFDTTYSESEDEITRVMTPNTASPVKQTRGSIMKPRTSGFGFTPLARRFDEWEARSPHKAKSPRAEKSPAAEESTTEQQFFEDEMRARPEDAANESCNDTDPLAGIPEIKDPVLADISITSEDLDLAAEANEMSLMSHEHVESMLNLDGNDDSVSDASQEYGDENAVPTPGANGLHVPPVTPRRPLRREVHTVSKIPLKPADESTPITQPSLKKRRHSISRLPVARPTQTLSRSATVISYSPTKNKEVETSFEEAAEEESFHERAGSVPPPETPSKPQAWSQPETPARTPRPDVNAALLRGAVVFVDVHTLEGADASAIFVELLTQMGARCVKTWNWNPNEEDAASKIGITHVVYKDGGKRTMEKVRETGGVVQCVGVGWVLDCERENEWVDESPYYIDTSLIPRGGRRRRKSMEPKSLANMNGTLATSSAARNAARESQTAPTTPAPSNRRDSGLWMHSPDDVDDGGDIDLDDFDLDIEADHSGWYNTAPLTPVPKTPAPDAIHRFAMEIEPDTPSTDAAGEENIGVEEMLSREHLLQRTCPPKAQHMYQEMGAGILGLERDESVARRLMDARRKSLAFAPKVSSPLAKSWKEWN